MSEQRSDRDSRTILVVDDDPDIRSLIGRVLESEGYQVIGVEGGAEALSQVRNRLPDLILLDVMMPQVNGWDVLGELRGAAGPQTPVVVMTAGFEAQDRALSSGAQGYLGNPFDVDDMLSTVDAHASLRMQGSAEEPVLAIPDPQG